MDSDIAALIINPSNVIMAMVGLITFATIVTLASPLMNRSNLEGRLKSVANRREELRRRSREALAQGRGGTTQGSLRHADSGLYKAIVDRLQLSRLLEDPAVAQKRAQAGSRGPRPITTFYFFRFVTPFAFAALAAFYLFLINGFHLPVMSRGCICIGGATPGSYA